MDIGSEMTKIGFAGDSSPRFTFKTALADKNGKIIIGDEAFKQSNKRLPVQQGIVTNWEDWLKIVRHGFKILGINSEGSKILFTEIPNNLRENREKMTKIAF